MTEEKPTYDFDLIVLGAGSAGLGLSLFMVRIKQRVLLIDKTPEDVGGDCLNYGCVPSKALIHASRQVHQAREAACFGLQVSGEADMAKVMDYVRERQDVIRHHENPEYLRGLGITVEIGEPTFVGDHDVQINDKTYRGRKIVVATGSRPRQLKVPGAEQVRLYDNQHVWDLRELPRRLLVVGGGPNGMELAQAMQRLGAQVTVVHRGAALLEKEDPSINAVLLERLRGEGITFHLESEVASFSSATQAQIKPRQGEAFALDFDIGYVAIGREVSFEGLQLEKAGVEVDEKGHIKLDEHLQTTNPDIFVAGDAANSLKFSHGAELHMRLLLFNFFSPLKKKLSYDHFSWVTFTDPEVAHFGLDAAELDKRGSAYERWETDFADDDRAVVDSYRYGRLLLFIEKNALPIPGQKRRILGGQMVAPGAGELIQELILANTSGLDISEIFDKVYPYPVAARINQKLIVEHREVSPLLQKALDVAYKL
ncbi:FAD-dependent pyridine nucleotide-disulphide oxidoreductase [Hymenobacter roseosalivarius DSM 11622]|uniref:FAD-dependent pyridine nucleotide-disulphide oxidoreductase n=1 Tax=Hymenobacter roseosalivarius DSM 11622 TaxID=645990 RepID=A0A1W1W1V2_9BACT|nr:FAD-dependent oxidoreductase [Hymenobacter roseosalivarius]SMB99460.1 FAD-dependent pyridine nucleotide-disulphide oxidoreductase [Hymenobacter roseosalivarius DSM 11622]